jgi:hypothetical protein
LFILIAQSHVNPPNLAKNDGHEYSKCPPKPHYSLPDMQMNLWMRVPTILNNKKYSFFR